jgi:glycosyltransferase involved in cell wall biosynthesis
VERTVPVSVIIPAYNAERYLAAALASVAKQNWQPAEIIVVDDGSLDRTREIAAAAGAHVLVQPGNTGPSAARNAGVAAASTPWIAFLDADDLWYAGKIEAQWTAIERWPDAAFCFTGYDIIAEGRQTTPSESAGHPAYSGIKRAAVAGHAVRFDSESFLAAFVDLMFVRQSSVILKREFFLRSGGYDSRYRLAEDYDFFLRLIGQGPAIAVERPLVGYRRHDDSLSADPLAELSSIDLLWDAILSRPERYPVATAGLVRTRRIDTLQTGALVAMRLGRFDEARAFLDKAMQGHSSPKTLALRGLWTALQNPAGRHLHTAVRAAWRMRPRRSIPALSPGATP